MRQSPGYNDDAGRSVPRTLPCADAETDFFWNAGADGHLLIQQCGDCAHWQHPPLPSCPACHGQAMVPQRVRGRGRIKSFTVNHQCWRPGLEAPFVFAAIELAEQQGLYVFSNVLTQPKWAEIGMEVEVVFEKQDAVWLPLFQPVSDAVPHG